MTLLRNLIRKNKVRNKETILFTCVTELCYFDKSETIIEQHQYAERTSYQNAANISYTKTNYE